MNYLLYGADTYRSRKKLREIVDEYRAKGGTNLHRFDAEEDDLAPLEGLVGTGSLFGGKKLIVIELALETGRQFELVRRAVDAGADGADVLMVLWEGVLRGEALARLAKVKTRLSSAQEFRPLAGPALARWIREEAQKRNVSLLPQDLARLASSGSNLWALSNELEKRALSNEALTGSRLPVTTVFDLGDTFFSSPRSGLLHMACLLHQGQDEFNLFSYLANHARTLLKVKAYAAADQPIPASTGLHPYVIKKASELVRALSLEDLRRRLQGFFAEDLKIKTGAAKPAESLLRLLLEK